LVFFNQCFFGCGLTYISHKESSLYFQLLVDVHCWYIVGCTLYTHVYMPLGNVQQMYSKINPKIWILSSHTWYLSFLVHTPPYFLAWKSTPKTCVNLRQKLHRKFLVGVLGFLVGVLSFLFGIYGILCVNVNYILWINFLKCLPCSLWKKVRRLEKSSTAGGDGGD